MEQPLGTPESVSIVSEPSGSMPQLSQSAIKKSATAGEVPTEQARLEVNAASNMSVSIKPFIKIQSKNFFIYSESCKR